MLALRFCQHALGMPLGSVGSWPALGVGSVCVHKGCEGWINHVVIWVTVLASFTQVT